MRRSRSTGFPASRLGLAGSLLAFATTGIYLAIILSEGNDDAREFAPWAAAFALIGVTTAGAAFVESIRWRASAFAILAGISAALGLVGLISIGMFLLAIAVLLIAAAIDAVGRPRRREALVKVAVAAVASFGATIALLVILI